MMTLILGGLVVVALLLGAPTLIGKLRSEVSGLKAAAAEKEPAGASSPVRRVLVIDDDPAFAFGVARLLKVKGVRSDVATSWNEAEAKLLSTRYDTVFCDYFLDQGHGSKLCLTALGQSAYKSCVMLSGISEEQLTALPETERIFTFLLKPCDSRLLERFAKAGVS